MSPRDGAAQTSDQAANDNPNAIELKAAEVAGDSDEDTVHPLSQKLFDNVPFLQEVPVLGVVLKAYSPRLVSSVCLERTFAKGLANGFMNLSIQPMIIQHFKISGSMCQRIAPLYPLGWSVNSFFTVMTDTLALLGYTKRWYCVLFTLAGGVCALLYARLPAAPTSERGAGTFLFLTAVFLANVDTSSSSLYGRSIRSRPTSGPAMVRWAMVADILGTVIASFIQGPLSDNEMPYIGAYIASGILFCLTLLFIFNTFGEPTNRACRVEEAKAKFLAERQEKQGTERHSFEPDDTHEAALTNNEPSNELEGEEEEFVEPKVASVLWGAVEMNPESVTRCWLMVIYCCVLMAAVVTTTTVVILGSTWDVLYMSIAVTVAMCAAAFLTLPTAVAKTITFVLLKNTVYIYLPGVLKTFYLAKPACLPDGPHFSFTFFNIMNGVVGNLSGVIGVTLLAHYLQGFSYRGIMSASALVIPVISLFDLILTKRWNMFIGIPDHAMFVVGNTILFETVNTLLNTPTMLLMSRLAARGSESLSLAVLAGVANLGQSLSAAYGHVLIETLWPIATSGTCEYTNAPWLVIAGHIATPALLLPLAFLLLPSAQLSATLDENGNEVKSK